MDEEEDYVDREELFPYLDWELVDALPERDRMSMGEQMSLLETIQKWREEHGI